MPQSHEILDSETLQSRELTQMAPTFVFLGGGGGRPQPEREREQEGERGKKGGRASAQRF